MNKATGRWPVLFLLPLLVMVMPGLPRADTAPPAIGILIDDMGKREETGQRVLTLPGAVACAFLPRAGHTRRLAQQAWRMGHEILLHLPMASVDQRPLDAGAVTLEMTRGEFERTVLDGLARVPHAVGINNHMGSLLTRHPGHMRWLMELMRARGGLFFVDSRTTRHTVALKTAREQGVAGTRRHVFLDNSLAVRDIDAQFDRLLRLAREQGSALAIGHPYPQTLAVLERRLARLSAEGIRLLPLRELIELQQEEHATWQAYSSPSRRDARNSKPSLSSICCGVPVSR
ncbi:MAG TPA: divergent polysaccharide deacetylase family protein [Gammaproteobacteria bacterium]|nr:divergent polysaccharide deacetylase family protein [Gammaproteobacteria bacterium]